MQKRTTASLNGDAASKETIANIEAAAILNTSHSEERAAHLRCVLRYPHPTHSPTIFSC
jgi:hypothetical protein